MKRLILMLGALFVLSACNSSGSGGKNSGSSNSDTTVNGKSPDDYFTQFVSYSEGECDSEKLVIHSSGSEAINISKDAESRDIKARVDLYLRKDHSFRAIYHELLIFNYIPNGYQYKELFAQEIRGKWWTDSDGSLQLEGLGSGEAIEYNEQPAFFLTFDRDFKTAGLIGKEILVRRNIHTASDEENQAVCSGGL